jgi:hypothetical protein
LDFKHDPTWSDSDKSKIPENSPLVAEYLSRLHSILTYGLWLTIEPDERFVMGAAKVVIPSTPKVCFTELKLSQSRVHAKRYGRLGIGVKRPYLFKRLGRPLAYFGFNTRTQNDPFLKACVNDLSDPTLLNFFKPMNTGSPLNYDLYSESEWRILYFQELLAQGLLVDPRDPKNPEAHAYFQSLSPRDQAMLKYLAPLDGWLALIIYPSLSVKNVAQRDKSAGIRAAVSRIKRRSSDHANRVEGGNWPIELNLDSCRNF